MTSMTKEVMPINIKRRVEIFRFFTAFLLVVFSVRKLREHTHCSAGHELFYV